MKLSMKRSNRVIYQISVADIQEVAQGKLERKLTKREIDEVERRLGDLIGWYDALIFTLQYLEIE